MDEKIQLAVYGLSYSQSQSIAYALVLGQIDGPVRIPVVIGAVEAQSIALSLENVHPPKLLTHDLFAKFSQAFGIKVKEVFIYKFEDGVFSCEIRFTDMQREVVMDVRTSDAIAIAIRTGAPIYTTRSLMEKTGFVARTVKPSSADGADEDAANDDSDKSVAKIRFAPINSAEPQTKHCSLSDLEIKLAKLIEEEKYEEAARVSRLIDQIKKTT